MKSDSAYLIFWALIFLALVCFVVYDYFTPNYFEASTLSPSVESVDGNQLAAMEKYRIKRIRVKSGHSFDITLERRYNEQDVTLHKATLHGVHDTPVEAHKEVVLFLNRGQEQGLNLYFQPKKHHKDGNYWEGEIFVGDKSLKSHLSEKKLLYQ